MNLQLLLFFVLLVLFILGVVLIFLNKKFRTVINCVVIVFVLFSIVYLAQKEGALKYKIGPLEATVQKSNEQTTDFKIKNPTAKNVQEKIRLSSDSQINNVIFNKGNEFFTIIDGGIGNNYIVYKVNLPPNEFASGSTVSAGIVIPSGITKENNLIK